jgi:threonine efflux protein
MHIETLALFALVHLLAAASPGPNLVVVSSYATVSRKAGLLAALGILFGVLTWASATALGLGTALANYPHLYSVVRHAGAIYLVWLGLNLIRDGIRNRYQGIDTGRVGNKSPRSIVLSGYLVNMTNPKSVAYYTSLFSVLIPPGSPTCMFVAAACIALLVSASWWTSVALFFSIRSIRQFFSATRRYLDFITGGAMAFFGVKLATSR